MKPIEIGDMFRYSWGYDQTNVDFYQVTAISPSSKSATLESIAAATVPGSEGMMSCQVTPCKGQFTGEVLNNKRIQYYNDRPTFAMSYGCLSPIAEGESTYCSWYA